MENSSVATWHEGAVVYQIFVDRFAIGADAKTLKSRGRKLHPWTELPVKLKKPRNGNWPHVVQFWGGDLLGVQSKLDYLKSLGVDIVYLTPFMKSPTNHRYDTEDYFAVDPGVGTESDFDSLLAEVHTRGMRFMMDGVFNHAGSTNEIFRASKSGDKAQDWFRFGQEFGGGVRGFFGYADMPAWVLENPEVRDYLWRRRDSVVRHFLRKGIDGWRLDVGFDIGPEWLADLRASAREEKPDALVVAEILGYPAKWSSSVDGVFNLFWLEVVRAAMNGTMSPAAACQSLQNWIADAGIEFARRCWIHLDNHDSDRFAERFNAPQRKMLMGLWMTLPGCPVIYYGTELGMKGGEDPANRAPMRWDLANDKNLDLVWIKKLIADRKELPAIAHGDCTFLPTTSLIAFTRTTSRTLDSVLVLANPAERDTTETLAPRFPFLMSGGALVDQITGEKFYSNYGTVRISVPALGFRLLVPENVDFGGYKPYERIP